MPFIKHFFHLRPSHTWFILLLRHILYPFSPYPKSPFETYFFHFRENKRIVFFQTIIESIADSTLLIVLIICHIYFRIVRTHICS